MTVEENRGSLGGESRNNDKFPVGMRVLAVDDDPTCLKLLEGLLRKCQYHVTTTSQARTALMMLRENRNRFDLVISDVHMPDMDGFKLLELVGLEMDLPVIMLSGNSDTRLVMKGITHGACDYLVKPVRSEELRNIWQHVLRRKKLDSEDQNKSTTQDKAHPGSEGGQGSLTDNADQHAKLNRKRKDEEDEEDNEHENEDPATQKKPRVVWSIELHRKFVAAVNQLGLEKSVPKRILDLMNVEGLSRENVASHLQKYRLYLKRISSVATHQAHMISALGGGKDSSYMRIGSLDGLGDFRTLAGSGRLQNTALSSYPPGGMLNRLNSPACVSIHNLASSALIQPIHAQNLSISASTPGKFQPVVSTTNQNAGLFQGTSASLELGELQQNKNTTLVGDFNPIDDPRIFTTASNFTSNSLSSAPSNPLILQGDSQQTQSEGAFGNQSFLRMTSLNLESFNAGASGSNNFLDHGRCNENWQSAFPSSKFPSNSLPFQESFNHERLRDHNSSACLPIQNSPLNFCSTTPALEPFEDSRPEMQCQEGLVGDIIQNKNQALSQRWGERKHDYTGNDIFSTFNSLAPLNSVVGPLSQSIDIQNGICNRKMDVSVLGRSNGIGSTLGPQSEFARSTLDAKMRSNSDYFSEQPKMNGCFVPNSHASLDDLMNAMIKKEQDGTILMDGELGFDAYSFGSCM